MTKPTGNDNLLYITKSKTGVINQYLASGVHGSLRSHKIIKIGFRDGNIFPYLCLGSIAENIFVAAGAFSHPPRRGISFESSLLIDQTRFKEPRYKINETGAAYPHRLCFPDGENHRLIRRGVYPRPFYGPS